MVGTVDGALLGSLEGLDDSRGVSPGVGSTVDTLFGSLEGVTEGRGATLGTGAIVGRGIGSKVADASDGVSEGTTVRADGVRNSVGESDDVGD